MARSSSSSSRPATTHSPIIIRASGRSIARARFSFYFGFFRVFFFRPTRLYSLSRLFYDHYDGASRRRMDWRGRVLSNMRARVRVCIYIRIWGGIFLFLFYFLLQMPAADSVIAYTYPDVRRRWCWNGKNAEWWISLYMRLKILRDFIPENACVVVDGLLDFFLLSCWHGIDYGARG